MTDASTTPDDQQARQDADSALYASFYGARERPALTADDETLYASLYKPAGPTPLTDEDQQVYNSLIPEN
jgi:hypothetical protein